MSSDGRFLERGGAIDQDHAEPLGVHPPPAAAATYIKRIYKQLEPKDEPFPPSKAIDIYLLENTTDNRTKMTDGKDLSSIENPFAVTSSKYITWYTTPKIQHLVIYIF
jgi:hypothetical protein